ncbi:MAG: type II restriction endonuclease [Treponema sp.]|nr:type II restriction endonuclease [Treponema sp.]
MTTDFFLNQLQDRLVSFENAISTNEKDWIIKGFIDIYKRIYTISIDTKIVSKVLELLLFPLLSQFAMDNNLDIELSPQQNFYPDVTFIDRKNSRLFALDIKTTYRIDDEKVNGMTLGAFTGYFRNRASCKNIAFPYAHYSGHFVLGIIYSHVEEIIDEKKVYTLQDLDIIPSVINNFKFFVQPKYKIASSRPGSGNTKNIGSITHINDLIHGNGPFSVLGEDIFDDYWMFYLTNDMAKSLEVVRPYSNLKEYHAYKSKGLCSLENNKGNPLVQNEWEAL